MTATVRQLWRTNRFEIVALIAAVALTFLAAVHFVGQLTGSQIPVECLRGPLNRPPSCEDIFNSRHSFFVARQDSDVVLVALFVLPLIIGAVLGAPLVARDVERRTAQFAWTVGTSRRRWLIERVLLLGLLAFVLLVALAIAGHVLAAARDPDVDPWASFTDFGARGPSTVARGLVVFASAAFFGAVLGRQLPALLSAGALSIVLAFLVAPALVAVQPPGLVGLAGTSDVRHGVAFDTGWLVPDGTLLTYDAGLTVVPPGVSDPYDWLTEHYELVAIGVAGTKYPLVEAETAAASTALILFALAASVVVVDRRRVT
jgi:hypothetical protein